MWTRTRAGTDPLINRTEQNTFYFKRVHSTKFSTLTYTTYNTRDKGRKEKRKKVVISQFGESK